MNALLDSRIQPRHLERIAVVYVRQSSPEQVRSNKESTRVQLGLREKAIAFGWPRPIAIDDDLGVSAAGYTDRPGFQRMLLDVATRKVGIIFCVDASRLSRNSRDWAHLFELCGHFDTLVADSEQIYNLALSNDRLVLGIKGTVAEMELSILRTRLKMGAESKASRGALKFIVPPGYSHDLDGRIVMDPDRRVQEAIRGLFLQFDQGSSIRQLVLWYRDTATSFPIRKVRVSKTTSWEIPTFSALRKLLRHPIYAGTYTYGRRREHVEYADGRLVKKTTAPSAPESARVFLRDNHPAYLSWEKFLANQARIDESRPRWNMLQNSGPLRDGLALLSGIARCGHCGRLLHVSYKRESALYHCSGAQMETTRRCLSFGSKLVDQAVSLQLCEALQPLAVEAAHKAFRKESLDHSRAAEQARLAVQAAQYEADRAFEQFDLVDPRNRLVADSLEARLNDRLAELQSAKKHLQESLTEAKQLSPEQRASLLKLSADFLSAWEHPDASPSLKKRILRAAVEEVIVSFLPDEHQLQLTIHWKGGCHTRAHVNKRSTPVGSKADTSLVDLVRLLADSLADADVARILNMKKTTTPRGLPWSSDRVGAFRKQHAILLGAGMADPNILTGEQAATYLDVSRNALRGLIREGYVHMQQVADFAPWRISKTELDSESVRAAIATLRVTRRIPSIGGCPEDQLSIFPGSPIPVRKGA